MLVRSSSFFRPLPTALLLLGSLAGASSAPIPRAGSASAEAARVTITVLATTDVHGNVWPYDYLRARPAARGLAKVSSYVKQVRARQPHTLVVDSGDTFQGTPLAYLAATGKTSGPNPTIAAMNAIGYDAMAVGNHEWNFGLPVLWGFKEEAQFPILGANIVSTYHDHVHDFEPYVIRNVGGVRVALLGMVAPAIPRWDPPDHRTGYEFRDLVETAKRYVPELRRKADLVLLLVHSGLGRDPETGERPPPLYPEEDRVWDIAEQVGGLDAILFGHSHEELAGKEVNGVLLVQAKNWAQSLAEVEFVLERQGEGWRLVERRSRLVPMDTSVPADEEILKLTREAHEDTERYLSTVIGELAADLNGRTGSIEDHPLVELIHQTQLHYGKAEVSLAQLFSTGTRLSAGPVTIRDIYRIYFYENELYTVEITGLQLREALEYSARSFKTFPWTDGESPLAGYNTDMAEGVSYSVDITRPPGDRIRDLRFQGQPLPPDRKLRVAINSYRWCGGGAYDMLRHAKVVQRVNRQVRDLMIDYLRKPAGGKFPTQVSNNWKIIPPAAAKALHDWAASPPRAHAPMVQSATAAAD